MTIVETRPITGGVATHLDVHVAAALDANGGVLGVESFPTTIVADEICLGLADVGDERGEDRAGRQQSTS